MRHFVVPIAFLITPPLLSSPAAAQATPAAAITGAEIARHVGVIADDSMRGRDTPSRELELTARYVASQLRGVGLQPFGAGLHSRHVRRVDDSTGLLQWYVIPDSSGARQHAPNVVAVLEGSDHKLKWEYVVFLAHMDAHGAAPRTNDQNDNASGTAGLLALARAFKEPGMRPRRSLIFIAVSGGAKERWGSTFFARRGLVNRDKFRQLISVINLDMIGSIPGDSITVDGLRDVELPASPQWIAAAHPELRLTVADGGTVARPSSDHFPFVQRLVPSLHFHGARHSDDNKQNPSRSINPEQTARVLSLVFYIGREIANADNRPRWTAEGRRQATTVAFGDQAP